MAFGFTMLKSTHSLPMAACATRRIFLNQWKQEAVGNYCRFFIPGTFFEASSGGLPVETRPSCPQWFFTHAGTLYCLNSSQCILGLLPNLCLGDRFPDNSIQQLTASSTCNSGVWLLRCLPWYPFKSNLFLFVTTMRYKPLTWYISNVFLSSNTVCSLKSGTLS